ncbi:MAG: S8/S53 family peptidase [Candidatus Melainabacteria bacterium]|nr:S8/S53 family peptidase [Candidatus Melainabacteria bacterium]
MISRLVKLVDGKQTQKAGLISLAAIIGLSAIGLPAQSAPPVGAKPAANPQARTAGKQAQSIQQQRLVQYKKEVARRGGGKSYFRDFSNKDILLVMPDAKAEKDDLKQAFEDAHGTVLGAIGTGPMKVLIVQAEKGKSQELEKKLSKDKKNFKAISFNKRVTADYVPTEPRMSSSWQLPVMNCYKAWDVGYATLAQFGQRSRIAVLDTGCSWQGDTGVTPSWGADVSGIHKEIGEKVEDALDGFLGTGLFSDDVEDIDKEMEGWANRAQTLSMGIMDNNGHGTWVAAAAAGRQNGKNSVGIAPGANIYPIKICDAPFGGQASADELSLVAGMVIAINSGARIVNVSYSNMNDKDMEVLHEMFKYFYYHKNGLIYVSAGNDGTVKDFDDCPYLDTVSALQEVVVIPGKPAPLRLVDMLATNGGWAASSGRCVDFAAPGLDIPVSNPDGTGATVSGSSFSSPIVAGVAALILSINPKLTNKQVQSIMIQSCHGVSGGRSSKFGFGMPDAEKACKLAQSM